MISHADLDHVAVAVERQAQAWPRYAGKLGAVWRGNGEGRGFAFTQVAFANGMRLEILSPNRIEDNDFLRRFLDRNGPGPHHLTFTVADLRDALRAAAAAGYRPVAIDLTSDPQWLEAFLHPHDAPGVVVQLAQSSEPDFDPRNATPEGFPVAGSTRPAVLVHIAHAVPHLADGLRLFSGLLAGREGASGADRGSRWIDLEWSGPGRLRLLEPDDAKSPLTDWIGDRPGRVHHLALTSNEPSALAGARPRRDGVWEVVPDDNFGTRLLVAAADTAGAFAAADQG